MTKTMNANELRRLTRGLPDNIGWEGKWGPIPIVFYPTDYDHSTQMEIRPWNWLFFFWIPVIFFLEAYLILACVSQRCFTETDIEWQHYETLTFEVDLDSEGNPIITPEGANQ